MMNGATIEMVQSRVASVLSESHAYNHKWCLILCKLCGHNINIVCPVGLLGKCKFHWRQFFHTIHFTCRNSICEYSVMQFSVGQRHL